MVNSRDKGKRGELELAHILRGYGFDTRRGQQFSGANGDADVVGMDLIHIECKRVEQLNLKAALEQAIRDARPQEIPVVMHRRNRERWQVTMTLEHFIEMYRALEALLEAQEERNGRKE